MKVKIICCFLVILSLLFVGCTDEDQSLSGKTCIKCGNEATHFAGVEFDSETYQSVYLYYCDNCYSNYVDENSDRIMEIKPDAEFNGI